MVENLNHLFSFALIVSTSLLFQQLQHSLGSASRLCDMLPVLASKTLACWNLLPHFKCINKNNLQTMATSTRMSLCQEVLNFTLKINTVSYLFNMFQSFQCISSPEIAQTPNPSALCLFSTIPVQFPNWNMSPCAKWQTAYAQIVLKHKEEAYSKQEIAPRKWKTDSTFSHVSLSLIDISVSARDFFI